MMEELNLDNKNIDINATTDKDKTEKKANKKDAIVDEAFDKKKFFYTKKVCKFCTKQLEENGIVYKNVDLLKKFIMPSGRILPRRISGNCAKHQRMVEKQIKIARILALLPFIER